MAATNARTAPSAITTDRVARVVMGGNPRRTLVRVVALVAAAYVIFGYVLIPVRGQGPSMWPTVHDGQLVLLNRVAYQAGEPQRGDIVGISLAGRHALYIKRIVGLPGERVRIDAGTVLVNGVALAEPYVQRRQPWQVKEVALAADEYLVIGDNRGMPAANHDFGKARRERLAGRVIRW